MDVINSWFFAFVNLILSHDYLCALLSLFVVRFVSLMCAVSGKGLVMPRHSISRHSTTRWRKCMCKRTSQDPDSLTSDCRKSRHRSAPIHYAKFPDNVK
ncbi:hypothetical protein V8F33_004026 [Rhypophila sp. PSN 637]